MPIFSSFAWKEELLGITSEIQELGSFVQNRATISCFDICDKIFRRRYAELHRLVWEAFKRENTNLTISTRLGLIVWRDMVLPYMRNAVGLAWMGLLSDEQAHFTKQRYDEAIAHEIAAIYKIACEAFGFRPLCAQELSFRAIVKHLVYSAAVTSTTKEEFHSRLVGLVVDCHAKINQRYTGDSSLIGKLSAKIIYELSSFSAHEDPLIASIIPNLRLPKIVPNILERIQGSNQPFDFFVFSRLLRFNLTAFSEISDLCFRHADFLWHKQKDFHRMCNREKEPLPKIEGVLTSENYHEVSKEDKEFRRLGQELNDFGKILKSDIRCKQTYARFLEAQLRELPDNAYRRGTYDALAELLNILGSSSDLNVSLLSNTYRWIKSETRGGLICWIRLACESLCLSLRRHSLCACLQAFSSSSGDAKALEFLSGNIIFLIRFVCDNSPEPEMVQKLASFTHGNTNFSIGKKGSRAQPLFSFSREWLQQSLVQFFIWIGREDLALQLQSQFDPIHSHTTTTTTIGLAQPSEREPSQETFEQQNLARLEQFFVPERLTKLDCQQMVEERERKAKLRAQKRASQVSEEEAVFHLLEMKGGETQETIQTDENFCVRLRKTDFEIFKMIMEFSGKPVRTSQAKKLVIALGGRYSPGRGSHVTAHIPSFDTACDRIQLNGATYHIARLPA